MIIRARAGEEVARAAVERPAIEYVLDGDTRLRGVERDMGTWFANLPAGLLNAAWQEDGHTAVPSAPLAKANRKPSSGGMAPADLPPSTLLAPGRWP